MLPSAHFAHCVSDQTRVWWETWWGSTQHAHHISRHPPTVRAHHLPIMPTGYHQPTYFAGTNPALPRSVPPSTKGPTMPTIVPAMYTTFPVIPTRIPTFPLQFSRWAIEGFEIGKLVYMGMQIVMF
ncbi:hypothetical protein MRX96_056847 [Rhipicephalus microplus]